MKDREYIPALEASKLSVNWYRSFKYLGTAVTYQNCIHEEIKSRLNLGNASYHSVQSLLSSCLLSKNISTETYKTIIFAVVLYASETWSLTAREKHGLGVFENTVLRRIFGPKREEVAGGWRILRNEELHIIRVMK